MIINVKEKSQSDAVQKGIDECRKHSLRGPGNGDKSHLMQLGGEIFFHMEDSNNSYEEIFGHTKPSPGKYKFINNEWTLS